MKLAWIVRLVVAALAVAVLAPASVAAAHDKKKQTTFVATVEGTDAYLSVVVGKNSAVAYLCDGQQLTEWLSGAVADNSVALESPGGASLVATRSGKKLEGTVILADGQVLTFEARVAKGKKAGLYREERTIDGVAYVGGWVELADGSVRGQVTLGDPRQVDTGTPPTTVPPTTVPPSQPQTPQQTAPPAPTTTAPPTTLAGQVDVGVPAPEEIKVLFPPVPRSATKETDAPPLDDTTAATDSGRRVPSLEPVPLTAEECAALNKQKTSIEADLAILNGVPADVTTSTIKEKIRILGIALQTVNSRLTAGGC
jgi:hypothetical protein